METQPTASVQFLNPEGLIHSPAFSHVAVVPSGSRTIYIGGQDAVDAQGNVVGKGDLRAQAGQILANLETALKAAGASFAHIIKWNAYLVQGQSPQAAYEVFQPAMRQMSHPPLITVVFVAGLGHPDYLVEMDAIAVVPE
ncbi:RidA family protein [Larkinella soli]|uniref:RidA family protein n=1 Tax=Larkinella soli TaxID=1770527 RepID=UPI000FFBFE5A|nr:RidA family protein [Larkinella soli]